MVVKRKVMINLFCLKSLIETYQITYKFETTISSVKSIVVPTS
jgi:hypothetical protein